MTRTTDMDGNAREMQLRPVDGSVGEIGPAPSRAEPTAARNSPLRILRLAQLLDMTGLGKTKIHELQAEGSFPMRVKITANSVGWIEEEVQACLVRRVEASTRLPTK
jgi:prophage regulatory protein